MINFAMLKKQNISNQFRPPKTPEEYGKEYAEAMERSSFKKSFAIIDDDIDQVVEAIEKSKSGKECEDNEKMIKNKKKSKKKKEIKKSILTNLKNTFGNPIYNDNVFAISKSDDVTEIVKALLPMTNNVETKKVIVGSEFRDSLENKKSSTIDIDGQEIILEYR